MVRSNARRTSGARRFENGRTRQLGGAVVFCALLLTACAPGVRKVSAEKPLASASGNPSTLTSAAPGILPPEFYPATQAMLPTTAGTLYLANINARVDVLIAAAARDHANSATTTALAGMLYHRFQILGRIADVDRGLSLVDAIQNPTAADLRVRASLRSGLHRFDEALADLAQAQALSTARPGDAKARRGIALATGDYPKIKALIDEADQPATEFGDLILRANLAAFKGDLANASAQFLRAQQTINDTDPFPVAWLYAQQGLTFERFGRCDDAMRFFDAALQRLPGYALAMDHQGECLLLLNRLDQAREVYSQLIEQTGNPEYVGGMARVEKAAGHAKLAQQLEARTAKGYDALLAREPKAWSEHAAEYYLAVGQNHEALRLARINLANRRDVLSLILMARAAQANGDSDSACKALHEVHSSGLNPPELNYWKAELPQCAQDVAYNQ